MYLLRTITAAVLFVCMLIPVVTPVYLQLKQLHIQHEMLEAMEKKALISIRVKADNIQWVKPGKECMIGAEMFDVKHIQQEKDDLLLTGLYDAKEKELKKIASKHAQEQSNQSGNSIKLLSLVLIKPDNFNIQPLLIAGLDRLHSSLKEFHTNPFIGFTTPPPRLHC